MRPCMRITKTFLHMDEDPTNKFQIREVPDDFFVDIVSSNNFLVSLLTEFFGSVRANDAVDAREVFSSQCAFQRFNLPQLLNTQKNSPFHLN